MTQQLDTIIAALPTLYPGPGGAVAVIRNGQILIRHAWGYANAERRIRFTPATLFRMCSITKQFTCGALLASLPDPTRLNPHIREALPNLRTPAPDILHLCHNQSGLRDYWATAMLHGAPAESAFGDAETNAVISGTKTLQFTPGTAYSYVNQNFRLISDALERHHNRSFAELLQTHIFTPTGMNRAILAANTRAMPDGTEGYEGTEQTGFRPAENNILWTGDAGLGASLDDMIAWERHIDTTRDDPASLYNRLSTPTTFADGSKASYGFGLARGTHHGHATTAHGGALRGWRSHRLHIAAHRLSVVVLFNHMSDAHHAALHIATAALNESHTTPDSHTPTLTPGIYIEQETGLSARLHITNDAAHLQYGTLPEHLPGQPDGTAGTPTGTRLTPTGETTLRMTRPLENRTTTLTRQPNLAETLPPTLAGTYHCAELNARLTIENAGGTLYAAFSGQLGQSRMERLKPLTPTLALLPCPRALDVAPPGDWTLNVTPDTNTIRLGCWLSRDFTYTRL